MKVCHLTSVHPWDDPRIFLKECCTLAEAGHDVHLVSPYVDKERAHGVVLHSTGKKAVTNRLLRMVKTVYQLYKKAIEIDAQVYHFHDPELLLVGLLLKRKGKHVIYDVHEDVPRQLLYKEWIPSPLRRVVSFMYEWIENRVAKRLSAIVAATSVIAERFLRLGCQTVVVSNYPILRELSFAEDGWEQKERAVCYIGGLTTARGIFHMLDAMSIIHGVKLLLAGRFFYWRDRENAIHADGWKCVEELGFLDREGVKRTLQRSRGGLVLLHPIANYVDSLPVKMFEYMAAGIPVICSDFPLWKQIVQQHQCGICVDPLDVQSIANAIQFIIEHEEEAKKMGENGRTIVREKYNWNQEAKKLLHLYSTLSSEKERK
ncbi:hypothetical protein GGR02_001568 [Anoxybacillus voinovskiensis]|uniref:Glycosyl transferase n=1 Tax=Anoxybacteroides voinovskiense TaxID=230470 RepID=A0A840DXP0_9BACL|nr:glycosyltransferase family 4 protein [Anoxybacillus voinovskiensis]MBB4073806.1 hypothetical protein [Anoxybacillus voinovskiensis]GGJ63759.1 glycosyltransferase WbpH [Anoxybacillus voinovskiensis]